MDSFPFVSTEFKSNFVSNLTESTMNGNTKTKIVLHVYDKDIDVMVNENDVKRYQAAASLISLKDS